MDLQKHYDYLWRSSLEKFKKEEFEFDPHIDSGDDERYGLTLLARPSREVKRNVRKVLERIRDVAPDQYYYPESDLHLTILSIISCYAGFSLNQIDQLDYASQVRSALEAVGPFQIHFRGITASPSCILVQGFPDNDQLSRIRDHLRMSFGKSELQHSIDSRYRLQTAHMTAIRFKQAFANPKDFTCMVTGFREQDFGSVLVKKLELVGNDWYQRSGKVELIDTFHLG